MDKNKMSLLIKAPYWIGIGADSLWAIALLFPSIFGLLTGQEGFHPDLRVKLIMGIGATLMLGWTVLLVWAVRSPIERRFIILLTAFPVVFGLFIISLISFLHFGGTNFWVIIKTLFLMVIMVNSYYLAHKQSKKSV